MGLDFIKKKSASMGKRPSSALLKINKYNSPKAALDLIGHICTAQSNLNLSSCFDSYNKVVEELSIKCSESGVKWNNSNFINFLSSISNYTQEVFESNTHNVQVKVAIAGGYSSGKSTFLNALTNHDNLLPTGIEPVSVVNTYLNCSSKIDKMIIKGENLNGDMVILNQEVLDCIRHSKDSNVNVACVLKKLVIDVPTEELYDGITFIDTPGYNNSSARNVENNTTDKETALSSFEEADVIFWCVDIEGGTITEKDFQVLSKSNGKPYVIVFTKKDKKSPAEVTKICRKALDDCSKRLGEDNPPVVIAYSDRDGNEEGTEGSFYILEDGLSKEDLIDSVKGLGKKVLDDVLCELTKSFEKEREQSASYSLELENQRKQLAEEKAEWGKILHSNKDVSLAEKDELKTVMIDSYNEILEYASGDFQYWKEEYREELIERVFWWMERHHSNVNESLKKAEDEYKDVVEKKKLEELCREYISEYSVRLKQTFEVCYREAEKLVEDNNRKLQTIVHADDLDVFSAISGGNYEAFLNCLSEGVDLEKTNSAGYSVLTWIAQSGNNEMMQVLIDNDVDLSLKDGNGYNVLEVAVMCHYKDICEMLYKSNPSLVHDSGNLEELSDKNNFKDWLKGNIK